MSWLRDEVQDKLVDSFLRVEDAADRSEWAMDVFGAQRPVSAVDSGLKHSKDVVDEFGYVLRSVFSVIERINPFHKLFLHSG